MSLWSGMRTYLELLIRLDLPSTMEHFKFILSVSYIYSSLCQLLSHVICVGDRNLVGKPGPGCSLNLWYVKHSHQLNLFPPLNPLRTTQDHSGIASAGRGETAGEKIRTTSFTHSWLSGYSSTLLKETFSEITANSVRNDVRRWNIATTKDIRA